MSHVMPDSSQDSLRVLSIDEWGEGANKQCKETTLYNTCTQAYIHQSKQQITHR